uniref:Uncharacterized protein n=1 Tax=Anguilla anguilla TaxID=7936 RepID=A0A0E9X0H8_ANGAN
MNKIRDLNAPVMTTHEFRCKFNIFLTRLKFRTRKGGEGRKQGGEKISRRKAPKEARGCSSPGGR